MKVEKIVMNMYQAILNHDEKKEKKLWLRALKKSLKNKRTQVIK